MNSLISFPSSKTVLPILFSTFLKINFDKVDFPAPERPKIIIHLGFFSFVYKNIESKFTIFFFN